jgi:3-oxoadipate enol-lactonase
MPIAVVNGIDLYYRVDGSGPPLVLAHGRASTHLSWCQQIPVLSDRRSVVTYDARGFGRSTDRGPDDPGMTAHLADLEGLIDHLGLGPVVLVGQSMGGLAVLQYAVRHPERTAGLVLTSTPAGIADEFIIDSVHRTRERFASVAMPGRVFRPGFVERCPELVALWIAQLESGPPYPPSFLQPLFEGGGPGVDEVAALEVPTLILTAEHDAVVAVEAARRMGELFPRSEVAVAEDCGHCVYWERPEFYNATLTRFLSSLE